MSTWDFPWSHTTYVHWASGLWQDCSRRLRSAQRTFAAGSSFWPTPTTSATGAWVHLELTEAGFRFTLPDGTRRKQQSLQSAAIVWTLVWQLLNALSAGPTVTAPAAGTSLPRRMTLRPGEPNSIGDLSFNPLFDEWLMGLPIGWTGCGSSVTGFHRWLQQARGELSRLGSPGDV